MTTKPDQLNRTLMQLQAKLEVTKDKLNSLSVELDALKKCLVAEYGTSDEAELNELLSEKLIQIDNNIANMEYLLSKF